MDLEIDVYDDSNLLSLLRPCKRRRSPSSTSQHPSSIPGPAAAVQAAILRKALDHNPAQHDEMDGDYDNGASHDDHDDDVAASTQDYIRRAIEDTSEFDADFTRSPWLSALQYLGVGNGVALTTPISAIKRGLKSGKIDKIAAVIKSSTPNGLGGLMVTLKDPTGTLGASIHHKVLSESDFAKNLTVGAVLILQNVAIFAPSRSAQYLNITQRNLLKVFCQDNDAPVRDESSARPAPCADPGNRGKAQIEEDLSSQNVVMFETRKDGGSNPEREQTIQNDRSFQIQKKILVADSSHHNDIDSSVTAAGRQGEMECDNAGNGSAKESNVEGIINNASTVSVSDSGTQTSGEETRATNEVQIKRQPLIVKPTLAQWTDEQLDELFAGDEDDGPLF